MSEKLFELYRELLNTRFADGSRIFDRLTPNDLCIAGHRRGAHYESSNPKLLIYGQAMNGWQNENCSNISTIIEEMMDLKKQQESMLWMADGRGWPDPDDKSSSANKTNNTRYYYKRSKFWKLNYQIITNACDKDYKHFYVPYTPKIDREINLMKAWPQDVVWSNLYKVTFSKGGNPNSKIMNATIDICRRIVLQEIADLKPAQVLFNTGENMFSDMFIHGDWEGKENLALQKATDDGNVRYIGYYEYGPGQRCQIVVCKRPDAWSPRYNNADIFQEAKDILAAFEDNWEK